jgi:lambda family phage portal protein
MITPSSNCRIGKQYPRVTNAYTGADRGRRAFANWQVTSGDADADTLADLPTLRQHSRDLIRNNGLAGGAVETNITSVVGSGLTLQSTIDRDILRLSQEEADRWESRTEREFALFAKHCDMNRTLNFYGLQELVFRSTLENGDVFTLTPWRQRPESPYELKLKIVEADRVGNQGNCADRPGLAGGIERDADGAPSKIHIMKYHPGSALYRAQEWDIVDVFGKQSGRRQVIQNFFTLRPDQSRGVPYLAPIIELVKQLGRYTEAEIMAAVVSSMFTVFVKSESGQGPFANGAGAYSPAGQAPADTKNPLNLGNGMVVDLAQGESIETANPGRPNQNFDPFVLAIMRQIGVRLELPFELLVKHFTSSYSASRAALNEAWKYFTKRRTWLADYFCQPVYELFMDEAVAKGRISAPGYFTDPAIRHAYLGTKWTGPGRGQINELVEVKAAATRVDEGFSTIAQETAQLNGGNFERNHRQRVKEQRMREGDNLTEAIAPETTGA